MASHRVQPQWAAQVVALGMGQVALQVPLVRDSLVALLAKDRIPEEMSTPTSWRQAEVVLRKLASLRLVLATVQLVRVERATRSTSVTSSRASVVVEVEVPLGTVVPSRSRHLEREVSVVVERAARRGQESVSLAHPGLRILAEVEGAADALVGMVRQVEVDV